MMILILVVASLLIVRHEAFVILPSKKVTSPCLFMIEESTSEVLGGDYAGFMAHFDAQDGSLIPVPNHLVPPSLLEWDAGPSCLEVLISEELVTNDKTLLSRQILQVLPEVGCGIDNLEVTRLEQRWEVRSMDVGDKIISLDLHSDGGDCAETCFCLPDGHRIRVVLDLVYTDNGGFAVKSPISIHMERKNSEIPSQGALSNGGGLTGSKVSELLGSKLTQRKPFCEEKPLEWGVSPEGIKLLHLPGNVTIATSFQQSPSWMLDVVYVSPQDSAGEAEKLVVRRSYPAKHDAEAQ
jgi:hypothetical protein